MKRFIFLSFFLLLFYTKSASEVISFLPEDDEALEYSTYTVSGIEHEFLALADKREINGKIYRAVRRGGSLTNIHKGYIRSFMREEEGKVYCVTVTDHGDFRDEILLYDFNLQPGDRYRYEGLDNEGWPLDEGHNVVIIENVEVKEMYGRERIVQTTNFGTVVSGIGCLDNAYLDAPFLDQGLLITTLYGLPGFRGRYSISGGYDLDRKPTWQERTEPERDFLPMLKEGRMWEYTGGLFYRLENPVELYGKSYYPAYRSMTRDFSEKQLMAYMRENCGQVFLRSAGLENLPESEYVFSTYGEETLLYDMNVKQGDVFDLFVTLFRQLPDVGNPGDLVIEEVKDVEGIDGTPMRRYVHTLTFTYLEGVGPVNNGTIVQPVLPAAYMEYRHNLLRMYDGDEVAYDNAHFLGVEEIAAEADGEAEYFTLQGIRTDAKAPGIYLRQQGGKTEKVIVR